MKERAMKKKRPTPSAPQETFQPRDDSAAEESDDGPIIKSLSLDEQYELYRQRYIQSAQGDAPPADELTSQDGQEEATGSVAVMSEGVTITEDHTYVDQELLPEEGETDNRTEAFEGDDIETDYNPEEDLQDLSPEYEDGFHQYESSFEEEDEDEYILESEWRGNERETSNVITTGGWIGIIFLLLIPVLNILLLLIWSFASKNKTKKNFCRALLLWILVLAIIAAIIATVFATAIGTIPGGGPGEFLGQ